MPKEMKVYTEEYRRESADYAITSERPTKQIAEELGINYKTFCTWVKKRKEEREGKSPDITKEDSPEVKALKKRNRELEMENEFLKKAAAFFAKEQV